MKATNHFRTRYLLVEHFKMAAVVNKMAGHVAVLFVFVNLIALCASEEGRHTRFEYKQSFKGPHLVNKQAKVPFWDHYGSKLFLFVLILYHKCSITFFRARYLLFYGHYSSGAHLGIFEDRGGFQVSKLVNISSI